MRLTKDLSRMIVSELLERKFAKRETAIRHEENRIALEAYYRVIDETTRNNMKLVPIEWFPHISDIHMEAEEISWRLRFAYPIPVPECHRYLRYSLGIGEQRVLETWSDVREKMQSDRHNLRQRIEGMLGAFNTVKQLKEQWPAVAAVVDKLLPKVELATKSLVVVPDELNVELELP